MASTNKYNSKENIFLVLSILLLLLVLANSQNNNQRGRKTVPLELLNSFQLTLNYFNRSLHLRESLEIINDYYAHELYEGFGKEVRIEKLPPEIQSIQEEIENVETQVEEHVMNLSGNVTQIVLQLYQCGEKLRDNFGRMNDELALPIYTSLEKKIASALGMKELGEDLEDFWVQFLAAQSKASEAHKRIVEWGLPLYRQYDNVDLIVFAKKEDIQPYINGAKRKRSHSYFEAQQDMVVREKIKVFLKAKKSGRQFCNGKLNPIHKALVQIIENQEVDAESRRTLTHYTKEVNHLAGVIYARIKRVRNTIHTLDEDTFEYAFHVTSQRDILYKQIQDMMEIISEVENNSDEDDDDDDEEDDDNIIKRDKSRFKSNYQHKNKIK